MYYGMIALQITWANKINKAKHLQRPGSSPSLLPAQALGERDLHDT